MAWAQVGSTSPGQSISQTPATAEQNQDAHSTSTTIGLDTPVLTIHGLCADLKPASKTTNPACQTVITRAQFETLADAIHSEPSPEAKRQLASSYPQFLAMSREAHKRGLDKSPRFQERLAFARLQILSQELVRQLQDEAAKVPEKDIEAYYHEHLSGFEEVSLQRIVIPTRRQINSQAGLADISAVDAMTKESESLRVRAAAGEDFSKLQKEAYVAAGVSGPDTPNPSLGKLRRRGLPPAHASVFDLKPGQVSQVLTDATGHYIYKMDAKEASPLDDVKQEISNVLRQQRLQKLMQDIPQTFTTDVNHAYFDAGVETDPD
jgi:hypothetical protein